jgi:hypothetical protein
MIISGTSRQRRPRTSMSHARLPKLLSSKPIVQHQIQGGLPFRRRKREDSTSQDPWYPEHAKQHTGKKVISVESGFMVLRIEITFPSYTG